MMKGMDPEGLAGMMRASGMDVTPDQARRMVDQLDRVSGEPGPWLVHSGWCARLGGRRRGGGEAAPPTHPPARPPARPRPQTSTWSCWRA